MKKLLFFFTILLTGVVLNAQTVATNFTCNDCSGASHTLFTELNAGKVIVMTWVMPCGACISVASTVATKVQSYASSNPGVVKFYLVDDYADTQCSTLNSWANTNNITTSANFSNAAIDMTDYGSTGMQKTVVIGGPNHTVFYNHVGSVSASSLQTAINNAIAAGSTGFIENSDLNTNLALFPNPALNYATINYTLSSSIDVNIDVINVLGQKVAAVFLGKQAAGKQEYKLDLESLESGIYFIKLNAGETTEMIKFNVSR